jgi:Zn-dependent metalloprotease
MQLNIPSYPITARLSIYLAVVLFFLSPDAIAQQRNVSSSLQELCMPFTNTEFLQMKENVSISTQEFMQQCNQFMGLPEGSVMKEVSIRKDELGFTHTKFQQYHWGIAVMGGEMIVNEKEGRIVFINGILMTQVQQHKSPALSAEQAFRQSLTHIKTKDYTWLEPSRDEAGHELHTHGNQPPTGELLWVTNMAATPEERKYTLGWKHSISVRTPFQSYDVYLDAQNGELLLKVPMQLNCVTGTSYTLWNGQKSISTTLQSGSYIARNDCDPAIIHVRNANLNFSTITNYTDADNSWPSTTLGKYIGETVYAMERTRDYYNTVHNRSGYDSLGFDYNVYLNAGFNDNAYYDNASDAITFGGNTNGDSAVVSLDIAGHEATHGMVHFSSGLVYSYQSGALNESYADIFGEMVERHARGSNDWLMGSDIYLGAFRNMSNPNQFSQPDTYQGTFWTNSSWDDGGVHTNSGVQNYWFYLLTVGGSGTNSFNDPYSVSGIGYTKARNIAYQTMIGLTSTAGYTNAKDLSIAITTALYGQCSNEVMQVRKAWAAVGVGDVYTPYETLTTIGVTSNVSSICEQATLGATLTASGATQYSWLPTPSTGSTKVVLPLTTTTYTVIGTNSLGSCSGSSVVTITVKPLTLIQAATNDNSVCIGQSTTLATNVTFNYDTLFTTVDGWNSTESMAFDVVAVQNLTLRDFRVNMSNGTQVKIWYKFGGIGNSAVTSASGWNQWGGIINVTSAGQGNLTLVHPASPLTISGGQTLGIVIATNGDLHQTYGSVNVPIIAQSAAMQIKHGYSGTGFNGAFNMFYSLACFNGEVVYNVNVTGYSWMPITGLSSSSISNPVCTPSVNTIYTVTASNGFGCTSTSSIAIYANPLPVIQSIQNTPQPLCMGSTGQLNITTFSSENDQLTTSTSSNFFNNGNVFNLNAIKNISINTISIITDNSTQAEVWYKPGGYGNTDFVGSTGWVKHGSTIAFSPLGLGSFTTLALSTPLNIPGGQTYGIVIVTNVNARHKNGTAVGQVIISNQDLSLCQGQIGSGFGGNFSFSGAPQIWCGRVNYSVDNLITNYSWSGGNLNNNTLANPLASPSVTTTYTATVTDGNGCTASATHKAYVRFNPQVIVAASPSSVCSGATTQMMVGNGANELDYLGKEASGTQTTPSNGGIMFNLITTRTISLQGVKVHLQSGATQAEVWYKNGGYGNTNVTSSSGWTKLGNTVAISSAGAGNLTTIPISTTLILPANATYGIAIVCNGIIRYSAGTAVGTTIQSSPEASITQGHCGSGFNGVFNFTTQPTQFNGELLYNVQSNLSSYAWAASPGLSNTTSSAPFVTPTVATSYSVTVTDVNGCTGSGSVGVQVLNPAVGSALATPSSVCVGSTGNVNYAAPSGNQCHGTLQSGFTGLYAPATWTTLPGGNGSITTTSAPSMITLNSGNSGVPGSNTTSWQHTVLCSGYVTFNWSYSTGDIGPHLDYPRFVVNNGTPQLFPTFQATSTYARYQTGTFSMYLNEGDVLQLQAHTLNNTNGGCSIILIGFSAPYPITSAQTVQWYSTPIGGSAFGSGPAVSVPLNQAGTQTYYAAITNVANGCTTANRVPTNSITVHELPQINVNGSDSVCSGSSVTLTAVGGAIYSWQPGGFTTSSITLTPSGNTTYTVTGTSVNGCSGTATKSIVVKSNPIVTVSASTNPISCGNGTTLTATGASSYYWMPAFTTGTTLTVAPATTTTYTVTGTSSTGCTATAVQTIVVDPCPAGNLQLYLLLEGFYDANGQMKAALFNQGQPVPSSTTDTLTIEFHNITPPYATMYSVKTTLKNSGYAECEFPGPMIGSDYYLVVRHRNSLETWSAWPVNLQSNTSYDFINNATQAYGSNQKEVEPGIWAFYSGDVNQDGAIDAFDYITLDTDILNGLTGYHTTDLTGDGAVDAFDYIIQDTNIQLGIGAVTP